jgi:phosphate/sulfate permease
MTLEQIGSAAISSIISLSFSMFIFYYLRRYLDHKIDEEERQKKERSNSRNKGLSQRRNADTPPDAFCSGSIRPSQSRLQTENLKRL